MEATLDQKPRVCFEIQRVIGISDDGTYQVQWAPAWVSKFHLIGCEHLIQEFLHKQHKREGNDERPPAPAVGAAVETHQTHAVTPNLQNELNTSSDGVEDSEVGIIHEGPVGIISPDMRRRPHTEPVVIRQDYSGSISNTSTGENRNQPEFDTNSNNTAYMSVKIEDDDDEEEVNGALTPTINPAAFEHSSDHWIMNEDGVGTLNEETTPPVYVYLGATYSGDNEITGEGSWYTDTRHTCNQCGKQFNNKTQLTNHMNIHKIRAKEHFCPHCDRTFRNLSGLNNHILTHVDANSYPCDLCDKTFAAKSSLKIHYRWSHKGDELYKCGSCDETFRALGDRNRHSITCTGTVRIPASESADLFQFSAEDSPNEKA